MATSLDVQRYLIQPKGQLSEEYELYGIGTHQTPLKLVKRDGASKYHTPSFNYPNRVDGYLANYGRSVGYILSGVENTTSLPSISFEEAEDAEEEAYLIGWYVVSDQCPS